MLNINISSVISSSSFVLTSHHYPVFCLGQYFARTFRDEDEGYATAVEHLCVQSNQMGGM